MYCIILNETHIFVLSIRKNDLRTQNKRFAAHNIMKKLLLLLTITMCSFGSMAMGFPQNTYKQQRILNKNAKKTELSSSLQTLEVGIKNSLEQLENEQESTQKSFVELVVNYVVRFFAEKVFEQKSVTFKPFDKHELNCVAIKKDFDYCLIG